MGKISKKERVLKSKENPIFTYPTIEDLSDILSERSKFVISGQGEQIFELIKIIEEGISYKSFSNIVKESPLEISEWSELLHVPIKSIEYYLNENRKFDSIHSDKILEIKLLADEGLRVFGNKEKFHKWLKSDNQLFDGKKPIEFLSSTIGINLVKDELIRIEYGVLA